ncbi:MAG: hypothetical protein AAGJ91_07750 [Pseudomonadota bacterium]
MARHILDTTPRFQKQASLLRYAAAARAAEGPALGPRFVALQRRAKGPYNPASRLRAYLRIARGYRV